MKNNKILISGCDSNYFPMLLEWIHSVRRFPQSAEFDIGIMNTGLTDEQVKTLKPLVTSIITPDWPCPLPDWKIRGREYLKSCVCRPFIPQLFKGYKTYMWMDADTWVQDWRAIDLFIEGASRKKITLTGQVDRAYPRAVRVKWLGTWPWKVRSFYFSNALNAFNFKTAKALLAHHVLLAGAFAMDKDAPHWQRWQELAIQAMTKGKIFTAEQTSLGKLCYLEGYEYEILPSWAHWLCEFKPLWDEKSEQFVEPYLPHLPIGILHISGFDEMRLDRSVTTDFKTTDGKTIQKSYRYSAFDGSTP
jgi:hypothetical protein